MQSVWMVVAALLFSVMGVCVKLASTQYDIWEIVAYRGLVGVAMIGGLIALRARRSGVPVVDALSTTHLAVHLRRSVVRHDLADAVVPRHRRPAAGHRDDDQLGVAALHRRVGGVVRDARRRAHRPSR